LTGKRVVGVHRHVGIGQLRDGHDHGLLAVAHAEPVTDVHVVGREAVAWNFKHALFVE
jgi:hypothetical protein